MENRKIGQRIIGGKLVSLDDEKIDKLEAISNDLKKEVTIIKEKIDKKIN